MKAYQHILLATDFSELSEEAARKAVILAGHFNAKLTLLHVVEYFPEDMPVQMVPPENSDPAQYVIDQNSLRLEQFAKSIQDFNTIPLVRLAMGGAEDEIIKVAREIKADLIVTGTHGRSGVSTLHNSTANEVMCKAPCDVLAVNTATSEESPGRNNGKT